VEIAKQLMDRDPTLLECPNDKGLTPLTVAAVEQCNVKMIRCLISAGANVNVSVNASSCRRMIHAAVMSRYDGAPGAAKVPLLSAVASWNFENTAKFRLISSNKREILQYLLAAGADPLVADATGCTCVHTAVENHHMDDMTVLRVLLSDIIDTILRKGTGTR
jgi:ankyrin repeat protein